MSGKILERDYFIYNGLCSCQALMTNNGVIVPRYDDDAYGAVRGQERQRSNSFKYVAQIGHLTDEETGLIYMRARYYDPEVGRFVNEDPGKNGGNWYVYCNDNSINLVDASGHNPILAYLLLSALVSGLATAILNWGKGSFLGNFARGFFEGLIVALGTLYGVGWGAVAGALVGIVDAWLTGGSILLQGGLGAIGGGVGGLLSVRVAAAEHQLLLYMLLSVERKMQWHMGIFLVIC